MLTLILVLGVLQAMHAASAAAYLRTLRARHAVYELTFEAGAQRLDDLDERLSALGADFHRLRRGGPGFEPAAGPGE